MGLAWQLIPSSAPSEASGHPLSSPICIFNLALPKHWPQFVQLANTSAFVCRQHLVVCPQLASCNPSQVAMHGWIVLAVAALTFLQGKSLNWSIEAVCMILL